MTNEHVIKKETINAIEKITIYFDGQNERRDIILNEDKRYIREYTYKNQDITTIEIIEEDNIDKKYFLLPYIGNYNELLNKNIYIVQFPVGKLSYCGGELLDINKYEITHNASTDSGSSGSPIFLVNTTRVIGIHKGGNKYKKENYGDLIYPIIEDDKKYIKGKLYYGLFGKFGNIKYDGEFVNDKYEGNGIYYYENGEYYIGEFKNGLRNCKGKEYYKNGNIKYDGEFVNDK